MRACDIFLFAFAALGLTSSVARLGNISYYIPDKLELEGDFAVKDLLPVTVLASPTSVVTASWLNSTISAFYVQGPGSVVTVAEDAQALIESWSTSKVLLASSECGTELPAGPYFASCSGLHRAWRLYDDFTNSFIVPIVPTADDPNTFIPLAANSGNPFGAKSIAVPSRLFYTPTAEQPLAGYRVAVKDEYDIKGLLTTFGSRSYARTYPPANQTSGTIQSLIDQGAVIVGKTTLSMFANAYFTASQFVDYQLPINVRADTYLIPGASSTGSGSAMIAYDWLDNAIGEDTGGSMRFPSALNGVFGIRSSINSTNNSAPVFGPFDTSGHFARSVDSLNTFAAAMYSDSGFKNTYSYVQGTVTFLADFEADYFRKFRSYPYITIDGKGSKTQEASTEEQAQLGAAQRKEFQDWWRKHFLTPNDETCSEAIVVFPFNGNGGYPWYRDSLTSDSANGIAAATEGHLSWNLISVLNAGPELVVPVGEVPYQSRVSLVEEKFPAAVEIQAAYGCDFMLMNLVREAAYALDLPKAVKTGRNMF